MSRRTTKQRRAARRRNPVRIWWAGNVSCQAPGFPVPFTLEDLDAFARAHMKSLEGMARWEPREAPIVITGLEVNT